MKRFVLDGPPGAGKSTVLFGVSDGESALSSKHTLQGMGYCCVHESVAAAHRVLEGKGIDFADNREFWLETIVQIDRDNFTRAKEDVTFYDRCFHHWRIFAEFNNLSLPDWYDDAGSGIRYDSPVFLVHPVRSMDLTSHAIHVSRRFTWEQRLGMLDQMRELYQGLGYTVVDVPVFHDGDVEQNNRERIRLIVEHCQF